MSIEKMNKSGKFVISLDFELLWGVRDKMTIDDYGDNILGVWKALPKMVELFESFEIKATFATVGFLFAATKEELLQYSPIQKPAYTHKILSPYNGHFDQLKTDESIDKFHYATELIELLKEHPKQEIASHTFSHYYCLEQGQSKEDFKNDLMAAINIAASKNISLNSLVFPRNQFNEEYLEILKEVGIRSYRGNEHSWFYQADKNEKENLLKRAFRLLDAYINISGPNTYDFEETKQTTPYNIPSSRFLRPYWPSLKLFEKLRLTRILNSMTYAAKNNQIYHLWWHPHNFGIYQDENFIFLSKILTHYQSLKTQYGFESLTMNELSNSLIKHHE